MMGKRVSLFGAIWLHTRAPRIRYARSLFAARLLQQHGLGFGARRKLHFACYALSVPPVVLFTGGGGAMCAGRKLVDYPFEDVPLHRPLPDF